MKSFKVLFMLAGLSSVVMASDLPNIMDDAFFSAMAANATETVVDAANTVADTVAGSVVENASQAVISENYMTQLYSQLCDASSAAVKNASDLGATVTTKTSDLYTSAVKSGSELSSAAVKSTIDLGATVSTKASDFYTTAVKSGSEFGTSVVKNASALSSAAMKNASVFGTTVSTKTSEMTTASVKFVEDNQTAVIISAAVATTLAITALVRYNMYGYVFYSSAKAEDKN